ncbi:MAG: GNAT family N-acetyltransferase [Microthrixaceae bacterium]
MSVLLRRVAPAEVPWDELDRRPDRSVFQTRDWLDFLAETQGCEPVLARVTDGDTQIGWFTGAMVRKAGFRFLGSPMRGWTTSYMGFTLDRPERVAECIAALPGLAFSRLGCIHLEVMDRNLDAAAVPPGFVASALHGYERNIDVDDDALMGAMTANGRRDVRRALRNGIEVEVVPHTDRGFAAEYYRQVEEAFAKRKLVPTYPPERVEAMIRHLGPSGRLLLLRAHLRNGRPVATGLFPGMAGSTAVFWMGASHRDAQSELPNEALMWTAMRTWRDRGAVRFDFGGGGHYKAKYGGEPIEVPWLRRSRFAQLEHGRRVAQRLVRLAQQRAGRRGR